MWHLRTRTVSEPHELPSLVEIQSHNAHKRIWREDFPVKFRSHNTKFIHIGKCGGTSIMHQFLAHGIDIDEYHMSKPSVMDPIWYFIWLRDPIERFISAFNHTKSIIDFDYSILTPSDLSIHNCPAPQMIHNRMTKGYAFDPEHDALVSHFSSANELAESLSSSNPAQARRAQTLMSQPQNHMCAGIGWYLDNGKWVDTFHRNIVMVGCLETMDEDFNRLVKTLSWDPLPVVSVSKKRSNATVLPNEISAEARRNLRRFYRKTDYAAISIIYRHGFISEEIYQHYNSVD
jgi:hypothetical protein